MAEEERNFGDRFRTLIYLIILPLIFALVGGTVLAQTFGLIDLMQYARQVPVVGNFLPEPDEPEKEPEVVDLEDELERWEAELEEWEKELEEREEEIEQQDDSLLQMEEDLSEFEEELTAWEKDLDEREERIVDKEERIQELADAYEEMSSREAAQKIVQLDDDLAVDILLALPNEARSDILAAVDDEDAGRYTTILAGERERVTDTALEERRAELDALEEELEAREEELMRREDRIERLAQTYEGMDPEVAGELINEMMLTNEDLVVQMFNEIDVGAAADILSAMPREVALEITSAVGGDIEGLEDQI